MKLWAMFLQIYLMLSLRVISPYSHNRISVSVNLAGVSKRRMVALTVLSHFSPCKGDRVDMHFGCTFLRHLCKTKVYCV